MIKSSLEITKIHTDVSLMSPWTNKRQIWKAVPALKAARKWHLNAVPVHIDSKSSTEKFCSRDTDLHKAVPP